MYKKVVSEILPRHLEFAKSFVDSNNSLDAYIHSHKHIIKVKASQFLECPIIWEEIINVSKEKSKNKFITEIYDTCKSNTELSPFDIFEKYCNPETETFINDPFQSILHLGFAFKFFNNLGRDYFTLKIVSEFSKEYDTVKTLNDKKIGIQDYKNVCGVFKFNNISINKILNYGTQED